MKEQYSSYSSSYIRFKGSFTHSTTCIVYRDILIEEMVDCHFSIKFWQAFSSISVPSALKKEEEDNSNFDFVNASCQDEDTGPLWSAPASCSQPCSRY